eukprot:CAMPEP_0119013316 /NCGR_PEP_ID=MMETSP1176-20130426/8382_1 /TAXON_ID=265551 /ORGANISM="Synedropsis recta cf, Strain CCMP1620" /LENGTH=173 /DNA_ID=CAMNT_0006966403 /DNA_START=114 /DNA_END=635 /DNA_ORIENTATION=+
MQLLNTLLLSSLFCSAAAFAPVRPITASSAVSSSTPLSVASPIFDEDPATLLVLASDCSMSESCSVEEAEQYMHKISMSSELDAKLAENKYLTEFVVGQLQDKIEKKTLAAQTVGPEIIMAGVAVLAFAKIMTTNFGGDDTVGMTLQEWYWSIKGGYFPLMCYHFIKDGGLLQ